MSDKPILQPSPDHPITVEPTPQRVTVTRNGHTLASSEHALTLREAAIRRCSTSPHVAFYADRVQISAG